jgi:hypothetical protein
MESLYNTTSKETHPFDNSNAADVCGNIADYFQSGVGGEAYSYDMREFSYDWVPVEQPVIDYFSDKNPNVTDVFRAIHVENSTKDPIF